jgi:hypothetical protein
VVESMVGHLSRLCEEVQTNCRLHSKTTINEQSEVVKTTLEMQFEYLYHLFGYKYVKDQVAIMLKGRHGSLKRKINKGEDRPHNCLKAHSNQLIYRF